MNSRIGGRHSSTEAQKTGEARKDLRQREISVDPVRVAH